jgi:tRNA (cmo5U34)-methyltransferase
VARVGQFHFDPETYADLMATEVPDYRRLQAEVVAATPDPSPPSLSSDPPVARVLDLGTGTGVTAAAVLARHPDARLVGLDESAEMLTHARRDLPPETELQVSRLEDPLPAGPFDLVVSALAVHHLDGPGKAALFRRVAAVLGPGGRFVLGDVVTPEDPADVVTPIDGVYDRPSPVADQLAWLEEAGLAAHVAWRRRDLAVLVGAAGDPGPHLRGR